MKQIFEKMEYLIKAVRNIYCIILYFKKVKVILRIIERKRMIFEYAFFIKAA